MRTVKCENNYNGVIMNTMAFQITSVLIVYSTVYPRGRSKKTSKLRITGLCEGNSPVTGEFPAQRTSNAENVFIWWRHHALSSLSHGVFGSRLILYIYSDISLCESFWISSLVLNSKHGLEFSPYGPPYSIYHLFVINVVRSEPILLCVSIKSYAREKTGNKFEHI